MISLKEIEKIYDIISEKKKKKKKDDDKWKGLGYDSFESVNESPDHDLAKSLKNIDNDIIKVLKKYENKADIDKAVYSWMLGLHSKLKKMGLNV